MPTNSNAGSGPVDRRVMRHLEYENAFSLLRAYDSGMRFTLHYHGDERPVTGMRIGNGCVWVVANKVEDAGRMMPVHIRPDGTSKDGPHIWLTHNLFSGADLRPNLAAEADKSPEDSGST